MNKMLPAFLLAACLASGALAESPADLGLETAPVAVSGPAQVSESPSAQTLSSPALKPAAQVQANEVVVTATRYETLRDNLPQRVDVVTSQDIARTPAQDFGDVMKKNSSLDIIQYPGALDGIGIRGFQPNPYATDYSANNLVLIDGHPAGTANLATLNTLDLDHVELLKGSGSALYGSQAAGGVLNLITRRSTGEFSGHAQVGMGSSDTWEALASMGGRICPLLDFDANVSNESRQAPLALSGGQTLPNSTYLINRAGLRLGLNLPEGWRADLTGDGFFGSHIAYTGADQNTYAPVPSYKNLDRYGGGLKIEGQAFGTKPSLDLFASRAQETHFDSLAVAPAIYYHSAQSLDDWQGVQFKDLVELGPDSLVWGLDYKNVTVTYDKWTEPITGPGYTDLNPEAPDFLNSFQQSVGIYAQANVSLLDDRLAFNVGGRQDYLHLWLNPSPLAQDITPGDNSMSAFSPSAGLRVSPLNWINLHSSYGKGFLSPNPEQLAGSAPGYDASYNLHIYDSNPNLRPESSTTLDYGAGVSAASLGARADLTWFNTDVVDMIQPTATGNVFSYANLSGTTQIRGLEGEASEDFGKLLGWGRQARLFGNFTQIFRAKQALSTDPRDIDIILIADQKIQAGADYDDNKFHARLAGRYRGTVLDPYAVPLLPYPPVWVWDLSFGFKASENMGVDFLMDNLLDTAYYERAGYPMAGANYMAKLTYSF